jgi:hypothetical protein
VIFPGETSHWIKLEKIGSRCKVILSKDVVFTVVMDRFEIPWNTNLSLQMLCKLVILDNCLHPRVNVATLPDKLSHFYNLTLFR